MTRQEIMERLDELYLDKEEYWLITGGAMVMYGMKEETDDIDLGCSTKLADFLENRGYQATITKSGNRKLIYDDDIEIFENWLFDKVDSVEGIPVISVQGLMEMKKDLGREKDLRDLEKIEQFLEENVLV